jgi:hypothetical protein
MLPDFSVVATGGSPRRIEQFGGRNYGGQSTARSMVP